MIEAHFNTNTDICKQLMEQSYVTWEENLHL